MQKFFIIKYMVNTEFLSMIRAYFIYITNKKYSEVNVHFHHDKKLLCSITTFIFWLS